MPALLVLEPELELPTLLLLNPMSTPEVSTQAPTVLVLVPLAVQVVTTTHLPSKRTLTSLVLELVRPLSVRELLVPVLLQEPRDTLELKRRTLSEGVSLSLCPETPIVLHVAPISNPKDLDTGGPHSLVFQESTGKYVHRHELEGHK